MKQSQVLREALKQAFRNHGDTFVGAEIPLVVNAETTVTPLLLVALGTTEDERDSWVVDDEGAPDVLVVEAGSDADAKAAYESIGVRELFIIDPKAATTKGYWLTPRGFADITPQDNGRVSSEELRFELGWHHPPAGTPILRFYTRKGEILETPSETEAVRRARIARLIETHDEEIDEFDKEHR